jgi:hypothetical protein
LSGQPAEIGRFHICKDTRDAVAQKMQRDGKKKEIKEATKKSRDNATMAKYITARNKVSAGNNELLTADDCKALLKYHRCKNDSPVQTKVKDLREQWNRCQVRLLFDNSTSTSDSTSNGTPNNNHQDISMSMKVFHEPEVLLHSDVTPLAVEKYNGENTCSNQLNDESSGDNHNCPHYTKDFDGNDYDEPFHHHEMNNMIEKEGNDDENALNNKNEITALLCTGNTQI